MGRMLTVRTSTVRMVMQPLMDRSAVQFPVGSFFDAAGSRQCGIRTADVPACGRLHYHLTVACSG